MEGIQWKNFKPENWRKNSRQRMGEMETVRKTYSRSENWVEKFQDGKLVQKPKIGKNKC